MSQQEPGKVGVEKAQGPQTSSLKQEMRLWNTKICFWRERVCIWIGNAGFLNGWRKSTQKLVPVFLEREGCLCTRNLASSSPWAHHLLPVFKGESELSNMCIVYSKVHMWLWHQNIVVCFFQPESVRLPKGQRLASTSTSARCIQHHL